MAAGTTLRKLNGTSTTLLMENRTADLFYTSAQVGRFMYITNWHPEKAGVGDPNVKYDGCVMTYWGITAPGSQEHLIEQFDSASEWTTYNSTVTDETVVTLEGEDAIKIDKAADTDRMFSVEKAFDFYITLDGRDTSVSPGNRVNFWTFIPCGGLTDDFLTTNSFDPYDAAMVVWVSPTASDSSFSTFWKFYFQIGDLVEGWNNLQLDFSSRPLGNFYPSGPGNRMVRRTKFEYRLENRFNTKTDIRLDKMVQLDEGTPLVSPSGAGTFNGAYQYKVTFISKYGAESNAGPASSSITTDDHGQIDLTNIPTSTDPQVTARRLYRTVAGGSIFLFLDEIENNRSTTYTDTTPDGSLGNTTPPAAGDFSDDNSPPPKGGIVYRWKRTLFMAGDPLNPETLYFSEDDDPESFPLINTFVFDDKITAIFETYSALIVETETSKWQVLGDNPDYSVDKVVDNIGCVGRRAAGVTRLVGYAVDRDGLRLFDGNEVEKISEPIRDKYDSDINKTNIELLHTGHSHARNSLLQFNPTDTTLPIPTYGSIFHYMYSIDDIRKGFWATLELPDGLNLIDTTEIEDDNGDLRLYASDDDGMIYELFKEGEKNFVTSNGTESAIRTRFQTPYIRLGEMGNQDGQGTEAGTGRVTPRFFEMRLKNNTAINWTITIESADGPFQTTARDSQTLTLEFAEGQSTVRQSIRQNFVGGDWIRFTIDNNEEDVFAEITGMRLYFHVKPFEGEKLTLLNN